MSWFVAINGKNFPVVVKSYRQSKSLKLFFQPSKNQFLVTKPIRTSLKKSEAFVQNNTAWMQQQVLKHAEKSQSVEDLNFFPLWGDSLPVVYQKDIRNKIIVKDHTFYILYKEKKYISNQLKNFLIQEGKTEFSIYIQNLCKHLNVEALPLFMKDSKSRWGSCSHKRINLSWRLVMLPKDLAHYVVAHEVAHILFKDHSPYFWRTVESICPNYKAHRMQLKALTKDIMSIKFN